MQTKTVHDHYELTLEGDEQFDVYRMNGESLRVGLVNISWLTPRRTESFTLWTSPSDGSEIQVFNNGRNYSFAGTDDFAMHPTVADKVNELLKTRPKPDPREFPLTPVLSIVTGKMLEPREDGNGMQCVMQLVEFMTGTRVTGFSPSQEQREACVAALVQQYSWLESVAAPESRDPDVLDDWVNQMDREHNGNHWMILVDAI